MPKMSNGDLKAILQAERSDALSSMKSSKLTSERENALDYYLGDVSDDLPAPEGRSSAVSTDVSDTVEGMLPELMDIFVGGDEVVKFDPVGEEDVQAAEQETDYVNHVFMQKNPGFLVLYSFIKDALLSKVGIVKVFHEKRIEECKETYEGLSDDELYKLIMNDDGTPKQDIEIVAHTAKDATDGY